MPKNGKRNSNPKKPKNNNISADSQNLDSSIKSNEPHELSHLEKLRIAEDDQTELGTLPTHNSLTETNDAAILARFKDIRFFCQIWRFNYVETGNFYSRQTACFS